MYYTLTPATGSNNSYAGNCDIDITDKTPNPNITITWNVAGNAQLTPWRIGGKSLSSVDRAVYSKTAMGSAITKIDLTVGAASGITVNSLKLIVTGINDSDIDEITKTYTTNSPFPANSTITFTPTSPLTAWAKDAYYKFVFNVTVSSSSNNKFVEFSKVEFYKVASGKQNPNLSFGDKDKTEIDVIRGEGFEKPALNNDGDGAVSYTSNDESVATVDANGEITITGKGTTRITATSEETANYDAGSTYYDLVVDYKAVTVEFADENPEIFIGQTYTNVLTVSPENINVFYPSGENEIARWDENGNVTGLAAGTIELTATWDDTVIDGIYYGQDAISYTLTVKKHDSDIAFASNKYTVDLADVASFSAPTATYGGDGTVTYESSNPSVATVNETTGAVTIIKKGTTIIKAKSAATDTYNAGEASYTLTVTNSNAVEAAMTTKIDFSTLGLVNGEQYTTHTYGGVTVTFGSGDNDGKYYNTGTGIRTYANGTINVTAGGNTITKIVMVFANTNGNYATATDVDSWDSGSSTYNSNITTWNGSAESVTVKRKSSSGHWRLQTITISYTTSEYTRTVTTGNYGTLCVPFGVDANGITGATFYTISGKTVSGNVVTSVDLEPVTTLTAGVGYIFKATANEIKLTPNNTTVEAPVQSGTIVGTFTSATPVANGMYILSNNQLCQTAGNFGFIVANRAYVDLTNVPESSSAAKLRISVEGDDATAITAIEATEAVNNGVIYNLSGQRVVKPLKGIYIQNGKKILVK